jgi:hypothetical protein
MSVRLPPHIIHQMCSPKLDTDGILHWDFLVMSEPNSTAT